MVTFMVTNIPYVVHEVARRAWNVMFSNVKLSKISNDKSQVCIAFIGSNSLSKKTSAIIGRQCEYIFKKKLFMCQER